MNFVSKLLTFGFLTWLIPFVVSFLFFRDGGLTIDEDLFKSLMIVVGSLVGATLAISIFKSQQSRFVITGLVMGMTWLLINWVLDLLLVNRGFFQMTYQEYFYQIGLRYLAMPVMTTAMGIALQNVRAVKKEKAPMDQKSSNPERVS